MCIFYAGTMAAGTAAVRTNGEAARTTGVTAVRAAGAAAVRTTDAARCNGTDPLRGTCAIRGRDTGVPGVNGCGACLAGVPDLAEAIGGVDTPETYCGLTRRGVCVPWDGDAGCIGIVGTTLTPTPMCRMATAG